MNTIIENNFVEKNHNTEQFKDLIETAKIDLLNYIKSIKNFISNTDIEKIEKAVDFATKAHSKQKRASGEPYILHPIAVAKLIASLKLDTTSIIVALLHDIIEDTTYTLNEIRELFGEQEAELVDGITKLGKLKTQTENNKQAENFRKLLLAISKDVRVLLIKLADRLHNMQTLHFFTDENKKKRIATETFEIYAPLAERMGLYKFKSELQDLAFTILYPEIRSSIVHRLDYLKHNGTIVIDENVTEIQKILNEQKLDAIVTGRQKTPHSIWCKMEYKKIAFEELSDIVGFRVLVHDVIDCYKALGTIHKHFHSIPNGFHDYISNPKINGYSSLHTLVIGPQKRCIEIQIRTYKMHEVAELGIAAHWSYKQDVRFDKKNNKQYKWLHQLCEILENTTHLDEVMENAKLEMNYNQVFCFTPSGKLIALPKHSTAVDFAFSVHSRIGLTCIGAKINGKIAPLRTELVNGDQIEILRSNEIVINPSWENIVITGKAKAEIRKFLRSKQQDEYLSLGRAILIKVLKKIKHQYNELELIEILPKLHKDNIEELLLDLGKGSITGNQIIKLLHPRAINNFSNILNNIPNILKFSVKNKKSKNSILQNNILGLSIDGLPQGVMIQLADCCSPIPGDKIVGLLISGKSILIHTTNCISINDFKWGNDNILHLLWNNDSKCLYSSKIKTTILNETGSLAHITKCIAAYNINIMNINIVKKSLDFFELVIELELYGIHQLNVVIENLKKLDIVYNVVRYKIE
jgi:GTP pyrophosphokinase